MGHIVRFLENRFENEPLAVASGEENTMPCNACGKVYELSALTCIKHPETVSDMLVSSGNKLSVAKFLCPEDGCGKSVDVKYLADGTVNIARYHEKRGERVSMAGGGKRNVPAPVTLTTIAELHAKQTAIFAAQMAKMLELAGEAIKSADDRIEAQVALIRQAETRIESIKAEKVKAEEILTNPDYTVFRKVVGE